jgi:hypothetical protein
MRGNASCILALNEESERNKRYIIGILEGWVLSLKILLQQYARVVLVMQP